MAIVYINCEENDHIRFENDTGAGLDQYDATVVGPFAAIADEDIENGEVGSFHVEQGVQCQIENLVDGEDTFATVGQPVYFNPAAGDFSDIETADYYLWGYLIEVKDSNGMIVVEKRRYAVLVTT
jgi:hypothetical protein